MNDKAFWVYEVVKLIPKGKVTTYGAIAEFLGSKGGARIIGYILNDCPKNEDIPAHRVVNRKGLLTGKHHFPTPTYMQERLEEEGLVIINDQIQDFEKYFWNPNVELKR
jgi:methylated-DNA-protein-cysteine methyltransferase-like protein